MGKKEKRKIRLNGLDIEFELSKVSEVQLRREGAKQFIYFEQLEDDSWRLAYTDKIITDIKRLNSIEIIRDK